MLNKLYCPDCNHILKQSKMNPEKLVCKKCNTLHNIKKFKLQKSLENYNINTGEFE